MANIFGSEGKSYDWEKEHKDMGSERKLSVEKQGG